MSETWTETKAAFARLNRALREYACEVLSGWSLRIKPPDYVPYVVQVAVSKGWAKGFGDASDFVAAMRGEQVTLDTELQKVLDENRWELYAR